MRGNLFRWETGEHCHLIYSAVCKVGFQYIQMVDQLKLLRKSQAPLTLYFAGRPFASSWIRARKGMACRYSLPYLAKYTVERLPCV